jgi:hypothetical protein
MLSLENSRLRKRFGIRWTWLKIMLMLVMKMMNPATIPVPGMDMGIKKGAANSIQPTNWPRGPNSSRKSLRVICSPVIFPEITDILAE